MTGNNERRGNIILDLSFKFSLEVIKYTEALEAKRKFHLANQLFRSGTSVGANIREAQGAESRKDFVHKMKIAYKEANETLYWLELCKMADSYPNPEGLEIQVNSLLKILGKIISSAHNNT